jgi:uncharacterized protein YbjT (DUF2867 family)
MNERTAARSYRAVVAGATGAVGGALVRELIASEACTEVVTIARRRVNGFPDSPKLTPHVVDFTFLKDETRDVAAGCDVAFCTIGIGQPRKATAEEFWQVDVELAGAFAGGAKAAGARHISLLSAVGANLESRNWYLRVKGEAEQRVANAWVERTSLFRPSVLLTRDIRYGLQDRVTQSLFPIVQVALPRKYHGIRVEDLARAMRINAERAGPPGVEVLEYSEFRRLLERQ